MAGYDPKSFYSKRYLKTDTSEDICDIEIEKLKKWSEKAKRHLEGRAYGMLGWTPPELKKFDKKD